MPRGQRGLDVQRSCSSENSSSPPVWNHLPTLYWSRLVVVVVTQVRLTVSDKRLNMLQHTGNNLQSSSNWTTLVQRVKVCGGAFARMCLQMTGTDCWLSVWIFDIYRSLIVVPTKWTFCLLELQINERPTNEILAQLLDHTVCRDLWQTLFRIFLSFCSL